MMSQEIAALVQYALDKGLIGPEDETWAVNQLLDVLELDSFEPVEVPAEMQLEDILGRLLDDAVARGVIDGNITARDLLDTKLMAVLTPRPNWVTAHR